MPILALPDPYSALLEILFLYEEIRVKGNPSLVLKLCLSTKFSHKEIKRNYGILCSGDIHKSITFCQYLFRSN